MSTDKCKKLTAKQEAFCKEYLIDYNGTRAAIKAGYSKNNATSQAYDNTMKPYIQEYMTKLRKKRDKRTQVDADWVINQITQVAILAKKEGDYSAANGSLKLLAKHVGILDNTRARWYDNKDDKVCTELVITRKPKPKHQDDDND